VSIGDASEGFEVPKALWGIFFEDINWAADGGLSVEMLANGGFDWSQADHEKWNCTEDGWEPDYRDGGMARLSFQYGAPVHPNTAKHLRIESFGHGLAGVRNRGLDGMWFVKGEKYDSLAEGYYTVDALMVLKAQYGVELPICEAVWHCLYDGADVRDELTSLFTRALKGEL